MPLDRLVGRVEFAYLNAAVVEGLADDNIEKAEAVKLADVEFEDFDIAVINLTAVADNFVESDGNL